MLRQTRQTIQTRALLEVEADLTDSQFVVVETIYIVNEYNMVYSAEVGTETDVLTLTMSAVVRVTVIDESFAVQVVFAYMANEIARGRSILPETITYTKGAQTVDPITRAISFTMSGSGLVQGQIDEAVLQDELAGLSYDDAVAYIVRRVDVAENTTPEIEISPNWFGMMPILPFRISVVTQNESSS